MRVILGKVVESNWFKIFILVVCFFVYFQVIFQLLEGYFYELLFSEGTKYDSFRSCFAAASSSGGDSSSLSCFVRSKMLFLEVVELIPWEFRFSKMSNFLSIPNPSCFVFKPSIPACFVLLSLGILGYTFNDL